MGRVRRGVVGDSRYARRLRSAIRSAAKDPSRKPVLISGEPGLEKDNLAALIHYGSSDRRELLICFEAIDLQHRAADLLKDLAHSTVIINDINRIEPPLRHQLIAMAQGKVAGFQGRVLFTSECSQADLDDITLHIRVPPLRVRRSDLGEWLRYNVRRQSRNMGWERPPELPEAVVRRLQNHDFANNLRELQDLVERALQQVRREHGAILPTVLPEEVFWTERNNKQVRFDIWRWKPPLRLWMRAPSRWNGLLFGLVSWLFIVVNLALWFGPQLRADNSVLKLFWAWWWPLILLSYPLVGRLWCAVCPFMVWGEIAQRLTPWRQRVWPHGDTDRWAAPVLATGFAAILIWEEVWNLDNTAWLSSCLLLLITAGAVLGSVVFEKRFWCRYLCPVGGMNGLFAKLSILELRAEAGTCSGSCTSYACFKGGPAEGEGLNTAGCPLGTHPAHLSDNRNCVLCMTCVQACPHRSVQLRIRPPAADLQRNMNPPHGERGLILVLAGGICLHHWHRLLGWLPIAPTSLQDGPLLPRLAMATLALALPAAVGIWLERRWLYVGLPLLWGLLLARHLPLGLSEAGMLLPSGWPNWQADSHVIGFCQTMVVVLGWCGAVVLIRRLMDLNWRDWLMGSMALLLLSLCGRWIVAI
tara:strand:+ start:5730 stop:7658 length:1929 start_codon:yes stop_codon:yes gene_type:complete